MSRREHAQAALLPLLSVLALVGTGGASAEPESADNNTWGGYLRPHFYGEREIGIADPSLFSLEAPVTTPDPAATPLTVRFGADGIGQAVVHGCAAWAVPLHQRVDHAEQQARGDSGVHVGADVAVLLGLFYQVSDYLIELAAASEGAPLGGRVAAGAQQ